MNDFQKTIEEIKTHLENLVSPAVFLTHNSDLGNFFNTLKKIQYEIDQLKSSVKERLKNPEPLIKYIDDNLTPEIWRSIKLPPGLFKIINNVQQLPPLPSIVHKKSLDFSAESAWSSVYCTTLKSWIKKRNDMHNAIEGDFRTKMDYFRKNLQRINKLIAEHIDKNGLIDSTSVVHETIQPVADFSFVQNQQLRMIIERDFNEIIRCRNLKCYKAAIILCGSSIEALLYDSLVAKKVLPNDKNNDEPDLCKLINRATSAGLITKGIKEFSHSLRNFRNLVHPIKELNEKYKIDEPEANASFAVLNMVIRDLKNGSKI